MERLKIENFLSIKAADIKVGRITVIVGEQASGKSIAAKLLYFFREFLNRTFFNFAQAGDTPEALEKEILTTFEKIFPRYTWANHAFKLNYSLNDFEISLKKSKTSRGYGDFQLFCSKNLIDLYNEINGFDAEHIENYLNEHNLHKTFKVYSLFIPAGRTFFATPELKKGEHFAKKIETDYFVKQFIENYVRDKEHSYVWYQLLKKGNSKINELTNAVLMGNHLRKSNQDWVENGENAINLFHASSGQQAALPLLTMLVASPNNKFFIEEPEAHLFPVSQKHIISLIALLYNQRGHDYVITTHNPYILKAINNAILARDVINNKGKEQVTDIFDPDFAISYEDVRAYSIENGLLINILNDETRLIGASVIDAIGHEFESVFASLSVLQAST